MTPKDRNIVAARLAGFRVAIVQPGERDIDATHTPLDGEYPCVVDDRGILLFYPEAESTLAPTCYWRPDADANQAVMLADRLREVRGWRFEAQQNPLFGEDDDVARYNVVWYDNTTAKIIGHANAPTFAAAVVAAVVAAAGIAAGEVMR